MKNMSLLSLILLPLLSYSQVINHFLSLDSKWSVAKTYPNATEEFPNFVETNTTVYGFENDTTINGEVWSRMYSSPDSLFAENLTLETYIRSQDNYVLQLNTDLELDTLYNFNVNLGDSILYDFFGEEEYLTIIDLDSVLIENQYYQRFHFEEPSGPNAFTLLNEKWIEGIGSIHGPLFPNHPVPFSTEIPDSLILVCTESQETPLFEHPSFDNCFINIVLDLPIIDLSDLKVYPNPFDQGLTVSTGINQPHLFTLFDSKGEVMKHEVWSNELREFDLSFLESGMYFLRISREGKVKNIRIVKR